MNKAYYKDDLITLYHGDCRDILPDLKPVAAIITDPVWPNPSDLLAGSDDPYNLLCGTAAYFPRLADRCVIHLGCNSDPRILSAIPKTMPFLWVCWLEYVRPHYIGRILYTGDVAYVFGAPPKSEPGKHLLPGRVQSTKASEGLHVDHPCPRRLQHVRWLVNWFASGPVLDPFAGSGTTLMACREMGYLCIGIEVEEKFCEVIVKRLQTSQMNITEIGARG